MSSRLQLIDLTESHSTQPMCDAVYSGLAGDVKTLPCRFFYDRSGSELFEQITELPEYYLTRCEAEILSQFSEDIVESVGSKFVIIEFGSGSSSKTRHLIRAAIRRQGELDYVPIDISKEFLLESANDLLESFPSLSVTALAAEYLTAIENLPQPSCPRLFVFLGSNIGNFTTEEAKSFLQKLSAQMNQDDRLLLGADLVKDRSVLHQAYNDGSGITAKFNLNLLSRINAELGGDFNIDQFRHHAPFDEDGSRIEMRLISCCDQSVYIDHLETKFEFSTDEVIKTEWSHKYTRESSAKLAEAAGLKVERDWTDSKGYFAEFLMSKAILV